MRSLHSLLLGLAVLAATQSCTQSTASTASPAGSPHSDALALVLATQQPAIRDLETSAGTLTKTGADESWWFDTSPRTWSVTRPFAPGIIDSTHTFIVHYQINGRELASWTVDTTSKKVTLSPPATPVTAPGEAPAAKIEKPSRISKPVQKNGLQLTLAISQLTYATGQPIEFTLYFKNVSDQSIQLFNADHVSTWAMRFEEIAPLNTGPETYRTNVAGELKPSSLQIGPGNSIPVTLTIAGPDLIGLSLLLSHGKQQKLSAGQYRLAVDLDQQNNLNDLTPAVPYWLGQISTDPVFFQISDKPILSSVPAEKDGLQLTLSLAKKSFPENDPLAFRLTFKNSSDKPFQLEDADYFGNWTIRVQSQSDPASSWHLTQTMQEALRKQTSLQLQPHESRDIPVTLDATTLNGFGFLWDGKQLQPTFQNFPPGKYQLSIALNQQPSADSANIKSWTGQLQTAPLNFEITK